MDAVQELLLEMRQEAREDMHTLTSKVDIGFGAMVESAHLHEKLDIERFAQMDTRLAGVESTKKLLVWMGATIAVGAVGAAFDFFMNHVAAQALR